ncbi:uncharacterized protein LOC144441348 [Glandiceps talaboti]
MAVAGAEAEGGSGSRQIKRKRSSTSSQSNQRERVSRWLSDCESGTPIEGSNKERQLPCACCPFVSYPGRMLSGSQWRDRQMNAFNIKDHPFPAPGDDTSLEKSTVAARLTEMKTIQPVMQWLLEGVNIHNNMPAGDVHIVNTVAVPAAIKDLIRSKLRESSFFKVVCVMKEKLSSKRLHDITASMISDITMKFVSVETSNIPMITLLRISMLLQTWLPIYTSKSVREKDLDMMVIEIANLIKEEDVLQQQTPKDLVQIRHGELTERKFLMCGQMNTVQADVEIHVNKINTDDATLASNFRLLTVTENKSTEYGLYNGFPQMACQHVTAAKESCFSTPHHYIVYNVSMCGKDEVLLSRSHLHKELVEREGLCINEDPPIQPSYFLYSNESCRDGLIRLNLLPLLNVYLGIKALLLLHREIAETK